MVNNHKPTDKINVLKTKTTSLCELNKPNGVEVPYWVTVDFFRLKRYDVFTELTHAAFTRDSVLVINN